MAGEMLVLVSRRSSCWFRVCSVFVCWLVAVQQDDGGDAAPEERAQELPAQRDQEPAGAWRCARRPQNRGNTSAPSNVLTSLRNVKQLAPLLRLLPSCFCFYSPAWLVLMSVPPVFRAAAAFFCLVGDNCYLDRPLFFQFVIVSFPHRRVSFVSLADLLH